MRFPRDWIGPRDELVPFGPSARRLSGPVGEPSPTSAPDVVDLPSVTTDDFWGGALESIPHPVLAPGEAAQVAGEAAPVAPDDSAPSRPAATEADTTFSSDDREPAAWDVAQEPRSEVPFGIIGLGTDFVALDAPRDRSPVEPAATRSAGSTRFKARKAMATAGAVAAGIAGVAAALGQHAQARHGDRTLASAATPRSALTLSPSLEHLNVHVRVSETRRVVVRAHVTPAPRPAAHPTVGRTSAVASRATSGPSSTSASTTPTYSSSSSQPSAVTYASSSGSSSQSAVTRPSTTYSAPTQAQRQSVKPASASPTPKPGPVGPAAAFGPGQFN